MSFDCLGIKWLVTVWAMQGREFSWPPTEPANRLSTGSVDEGKEQASDGAADSGSDLMDINMPRINGIEATKLIASASPGVKVIGLSIHDADVMAQRMLEAGTTRSSPSTTALNQILPASSVYFACVSG